MKTTDEITADILAALLIVMGSVVLFVLGFLVYNPPLECKKTQWEFFVVTYVEGGEHRHQDVTLKEIDSDVTHNVYISNANASYCHMPTVGDTLGFNVCYTNDKKHILNVKSRFCY